MRTRHKIPTIFNLSMVDVLCCALGCVILLWLVNFREAKRRTLAAGETAVKLDAANQELADFRSRLSAAQQQLAALQGERDAAVMRAELTARDRDKVRGQLSDVEDRLSKKTLDAQGLTRTLALTEKEREALQALLRDKDIAALKALPAWPCLASGCPSRVVAAAAAEPGVPISTEVMVSEVCTTASDPTSRIIAVCTSSV